MLPHEPPDAVVRALGVRAAHEKFLLIGVQNGFDDVPDSLGQAVRDKVPIGQLDLMQIRLKGFFGARFNVPNLDRSNICVRFSPI